MPITHAFIGSCTNGRIEDLRAAAAIAQGRKVAPGIKAIVVPGSAATRAQAEAEGLDRMFRDAGFEWRFAGCSMCVAMNDDRLAPGDRCASTSNRNFEGRQGPGGRTHLMSPAMAAAAAIAGCLADVRELAPMKLQPFTRVEGHAAALARRQCRYRHHLPGALPAADHARRAGRSTPSMIAAIMPMAARLPSFVLNRDAVPRCAR